MKPTQDLPCSLQYILVRIFKYDTVFLEIFCLFVSWNFDENMFLTTLVIFQFMSKAPELFLKDERLGPNPAWVFL